MTQDTLDKLFQLTSFAESPKDPPRWGDMKILEGEYAYVPQCSYFGGTLIQLAETYEQSGDDCLFIQELVRLYLNGELRFKEVS